jgi:hypothetical protein
MTLSLDYSSVYRMRLAKIASNGLLARRRDGEAEEGRRAIRGMEVAVCVTSECAVFQYPGTWI